MAKKTSKRLKAIKEWSALTKDWDVDAEYHNLIMETDGKRRVIRPKPKRKSR